MKKAVIALVISSALGLAACQPQTEAAKEPEAPSVKLENDEQKLQYAMGAGLGKYIENQLAMQKDIGMEFDQQLVVQGFLDAVEKKSLLNDEELATFSDKLKQKLMQAQQAAQAKQAEENLAKSQAFLAENGKREGIKTTDSGLQIETIEEGSGASPVATDQVKVHYKGTLIDGTKFDSSYDRNQPAQFRLNGVIAGWTEGLQHMKTGGKYKLYIPSELAYGSRNSARIPANSALVFDIELLDVIGTSAEQ